MQLLIDIGNTRLKWATTSANQLHTAGALEHQGITASLLVSRIAQTLPQTISHIYVASVASSEFTTRLCKVLEQQLQSPVTQIHSSAYAASVHNGYEQPEKLGVDRWLAIIAGFAQTGACLVVDAGTALTLDWVNAQGRHQGGLIAPGLHTQWAALTAHTQLPPANWDDNIPVWACDTHSAIRRGIMGNLTALIMQHWQLADKPTLLLTGGDATVISTQLSIEHLVIGDLVLRGLLLATPNKKRA